MRDTARILTTAPGIRDASAHPRPQLVATAAAQQWPAAPPPSGTVLSCPQLCAGAAKVVLGSMACVSPAGSHAATSTDHSTPALDLAGAALGAVPHMTARATSPMHPSFMAHRGPLPLPGKVCPLPLLTLGISNQFVGRVCSLRLEEYIIVTMPSRVWTPDVAEPPLCSMPAERQTPT